MFKSREQTEVIKWLKLYPNIKIVSKDDSVTYHNSISQANPRAKQISDRFYSL